METLVGLCVRSFIRNSHHSTFPVTRVYGACVLCSAVVGVTACQHVGRREPCHAQRRRYSSRDLQSDAEKNSRHSTLTTYRGARQLRSRAR